MSGQKRKSTTSRNYSRKDGSIDVTLSEIKAEVKKNPILGLLKAILYVFGIAILIKWLFVGF